MIQENENVRLSIYGKFSRAGVVEAKPEDIKAEMQEITLTPKAAEMIYNDLEKLFK